MNTLLDLRGCNFAYSDEESLSGSKIVLRTLKEKGENASFFGSLLSMWNCIFLLPSLSTTSLPFRLIEFNVLSGYLPIKCFLNLKVKTCFRVWLTFSISSNGVI